MNGTLLLLMDVGSILIAVRIVVQQARDFGVLSAREIGSAPSKGHNEGGEHIPQRHPSSAGRSQGRKSKRPWNVELLRPVW